MGNPAVAVAFAVLSTATVIVLVFFGVPLLYVVPVTLGLIATDALLLTFHPAAVVASAGTYILAALIGITGFSILGLLASMV